MHTARAHGFKILVGCYGNSALANTAASVVAVIAILIAMQVWGPTGAIVGTAAGQGLELIVMGVLLVRGIKAARALAKDA